MLPATSRPPAGRILSRDSSRQAKIGGGSVPRTGLPRHDFPLLLPGRGPRRRRSLASSPGGGGGGGGPASSSARRSAAGLISARVRPTTNASLSGDSSWDPARQKPSRRRGVAEGWAPPLRPRTRTVHSTSSAWTVASSRSGSTGDGGASTAAMARTGVGFERLFPCRSEPSLASASDRSFPAGSGEPFPSRPEAESDAGLGGAGRTGRGRGGPRRSSSPLRSSEGFVIIQEGCRQEGKPPY